MEVSVLHPARPTTIRADLSPLGRRFDEVRAATERLTRPLAVEDYVVSSMPDVSPTKWHLAHTSWFFETFVLAPFAPGYRSPDPRYAFLFNSYYVQAGERHCRAQRGLVTRPTVAEVFEYRAHVDDGMRTLIRAIGGDAAHPARPIIELGLHHEQQHQELVLMDIKHVFWTNPMRPAYLPAAPRRETTVPELDWVRFDEGVHHIGHDAPGFAFDNEGPRHRTLVHAFALATRLTTNGEYLAFIEDGGYERATLWLSSGWATVQDQRWTAPLYWEQDDDGWTEFTLHGPRPLDLSAPVSHVSYFEADAFARWASARLPGEAEWEVAAADVPVDGPFVEAGACEPSPAPAGRTGESLLQMYGDLWQWTASPYLAYPGYVPAGGAIGEYNGKFMCDQWVLRGASCATPRSHARRSYRNFFPAAARWHFGGIRLARDAESGR